jgi:hypothetical protein
MAFPWLEERSEMEDSVSKPTAITVSRIISDKVTMSAKPFRVAMAGCSFISIQ